MQERRDELLRSSREAHERLEELLATFSDEEMALALVRANDTIYNERLWVRNMVKNHHLTKSIQDEGWSAFLTILTYKAAWAGRRVIAVNPAFTS
jgi:putative transposase